MSSSPQPRVALPWAGKSGSDARMKTLLQPATRTAITALCLLLFGCAAHAASPPPADAGSPSRFAWISNTPGNLMKMGRALIAPENRWSVAAILASSALLISYDQEILDSVQDLSRDLGLIDEHTTGLETRTTTLFTINGYEVPLHIPKNTVGWMFYLGDGIVQIPVMSSFWVYGALKSDTRANATGDQIAEALLTTGVTVQLLKRSFGRESPFKRTADGGAWRPFPSFDDYNSRVPRYDAMPSGHLATVMATTTVIAENYPEKRYIWPIGITTMTLLGYGMLTNGVHWAGDYPLGLAIGYTAGKIAVANHRNHRGLTSRVGVGKTLFVPQFSPDFMGLTCLTRF